MANSTKLQRQINEAKAARKIVFVYCIYGPAAPKRKYHNDNCCSVHAFNRNDRRGIGAALRVRNGT